MSAHTPGPWIVYDCRDNPHDPIWVGTPAPGVGLQSLVAEVSTTEGIRTGPGESEANVQANARLIAAAPEMYAALKDTTEAAALAMRMFAECDVSDAYIDAGHAIGIKDGFYARARAAIAKAEGRQ